MTNGQRAGADAWIAGTYDPKLRLIYFGTGQAKSGKNGIGNKLFSNATVALDVDTGKLKWYHQPAPDEGLDLDEVYEKVLIDEGPRKLLLTAGKKGILWELDPHQRQIPALCPHGVPECLYQHRSRDRPRHLPPGYSATRARQLASSPARLPVRRP